VWRPIFSQHVRHCSKHEIDEHWSLIDLVDCHRLIDLHEELEQRAAAKAKAAAKR